MYPDIMNPSSVDEMLAKVEASIEEPTEVDANGRCITTGKFVKGQAKGGPGRPKGSRSKMTQNMLNRVFARSEAGLSMEEIMMSIAQDPQAPLDLRFKAASKVADLVYPKASSVEVKMDDAESMTKEQIDQKLATLIALATVKPE